ncbi:hypothetical protein [Agromyces sp. ZXT2-6]|uniref:hypothetical protein n=1 Tax=Agromyces sp. ZXT2-6 TaxID=3461153 RepID=UPI004054CE37
MELLFVTLGGALLGLAARYTIPRRGMHGVVVVPAVGAAAAAVAWVALTWVGLAWDGGWIWVIALVAAALASVGVAMYLGPRRERLDAELFAHLAKVGVARS